MSSFYIWLPIFIVIIILVTASVVSKMQFDRKRATVTRTVVRQGAVSTINGTNNTVIYTIPNRPVGSSVYPERIVLSEPHHRRGSTTVRINGRVIDDAPPSYDQALSDTHNSVATNSVQVDHSTRIRIV